MDIIQPMAPNMYGSDEEFSADLERYRTQLSAAAREGGLTLEDLHRAGPEGARQILLKLGHHIVSTAGQYD